MTMVTITGRYTPQPNPFHECKKAFLSPDGKHLDEGRVEMVDTNDYYYEY